MDRFHWAESFWQLNGAMLDKYASCKDSGETIAAQQAFMDELQSERQERQEEAARRTAKDGGGYGIEDMMPPSESEEEYEEEQEEQEEHEQDAQGSGFSKRVADVAAEASSKLGNTSIND